MTTKKTARHSRLLEPTGLLRWVFLKGRTIISCAVRLDGPHCYDVCVVPHADLAATVIERYRRASEASARHAEIAQHFRDAGWILIRERSAEPRTAA